MPEGPDLAIAALYICRVCSNKKFSRIVKSTVSRCPEISWTDGDNFRVSAVSRGKELMLSLVPSSPSMDCGGGTKYILFHFGMSGRFSFTDASSTPKHSHLSFITSDGAEALHFVDTRRFGKWELKTGSNDWSEARGPSPLTEYTAFRENIANSLDDKVFTRPLCEAMLDQRYFNGIGNYLRAEIIFRAGVQPFQKARIAVEAALEKTNGGTDSNDDQSPEDFLSLCKIVQEEAIALQNTNSTSSSNDYLSDTYNGFEQWLQCYGKPTMQKVRDGNGRMMWYSGLAGGPTAAKKKKGRRNRDGNPGAGPISTSTNEGAIAENTESKAEQSEESVSMRRKRSNRRVVTTKGDGAVNVTAADTETTYHLTDTGERVLTRNRAKVLKLDAKQQISLK